MHPMAKTRSRYQVSLQLEPRIRLEAVILNRLEQISEECRQEWLRGLLVQGFLIECQALQRVAVKPISRIGAGFPDWLTGNSTKQAVSHDQKLEPGSTAKTGNDAIGDAEKPFSHLRRVIG
jgi:hypothetical protein